MKICQRIDVLEKIGKLNSSRRGSLMEHGPFLLKTKYL